jgi:hypothetical protein
MSTNGDANQARPFAPSLIFASKIRSESPMLMQIKLDCLPLFAK